MKYIFDTCSIIGVGLIGGSIGLGLKKSKLVNKVIGVGYRQKSIKAAIRKSAIDYGTTDMKKGISGSDLVIIATPVSLIPQKLKEAIPYLKNDAIVTDVGSTKCFILQEFKNILSGFGLKKKKCFSFIGGHPIAGSEYTGVEFSTANLFHNSICVLTPTKSYSKLALGKLSNIWESLGATVINMTAENHDKILARTSHLPQLVAFSLANIIKENQWPFSGGGLKDVTRIASSDPDLWIDICHQNKGNIVQTIDLFIKELSIIKNKLVNDDNKNLRKRFNNARRKRNEFYGCD